MGPMWSTRLSPLFLSPGINFLPKTPLSKLDFAFFNVFFVHAYNVYVHAISFSAILTLRNPSGEYSFVTMYSASKKISFTRCFVTN